MWGKPNPKRANLVMSERKSKHRSFFSPKSHDFKTHLIASKIMFALALIVIGKKRELLGISL